MPARKVEGIAGAKHPEAKRSTPGNAGNKTMGVVKAKSWTRRE